MPPLRIWLVFPPGNLLRVGVLREGLGNGEGQARRALIWMRLFHRLGEISADEHVPGYPTADPVVFWIAGRERVMRYWAGSSHGKS